MSSFSRDRIIRIKIVYGGPPQSGKAANLQLLQVLMREQGESKLLGLTSAGEQVLLLESPRIALNLKPACFLDLQIYTVTGEVKDSLARRALVDDADGMVVVLDARRERFRANLVHWADLLEHLRHLKVPLSSLPIVFQYNQHKDFECVSTSDLDASFNPERHPSFGADVGKGLGIGRCLVEVVRRAVARAHQELALESRGIARAALASAVDTALSSWLRDVIGNPNGVDTAEPSARKGPGEVATPARSSKMIPKASATTSRAAPGAADRQEETRARSESEAVVRREDKATGASPSSAGHGPHETVQEVLIRLLAERCELLDRRLNKLRGAVVRWSAEGRKPSDVAEWFKSPIRADGSKPCSLSEVLDTVCRQLKTALLKRDIHVQIDPLPRFLGHRSVLAYLFRKLVETIVEHSVVESGPSEISVKNKLAGKGLWIELEQRGRSKERTAAPGGRGSAHLPRLPVAEQIVSVHGGQMRMRWTPDRGVIIRLVLPRARVLADRLHPVGV